MDAWLGPLDHDPHSRLSPAQDWSSNNSTQPGFVGAGGPPGSSPRGSRRGGGGGRDKSGDLSRIHAQSSAETSGLGDSLQRIHTLSSTETAPSPGYSGGYDVSPSGAAAAGGHSPSSSRYRRSASYDEMPGTAGQDQNFDSFFEKAEEREVFAAIQKARRDKKLNRGDSGQADHHLGEDDEVAGYMDGHTPPLSRTGSSWSLSKAAGKDGQFLGAHTRSTWLSWSQARRASFKKRLDSIEQRQKELATNRVSTPVKKARKESVMFVSPELEGAHVPPDDDHSSLVAKKLEKFIPPGPSKKQRLLQAKSADPDEVKLTLSEWNILVAYFEHDVFIKTRYAGLILSALALILAVVSLTNQQWSQFKDHPYYGASHSGLWYICSTTTFNCTSSLQREFIDPESFNWQNAVIGLLVFSVAFGFLAACLSIAGIITLALPRKIYYYHSAGEIYFICALATSAALVIYPVAIELERRLSPAHTFGVGFLLGWLAALLFLLAALAMCLDDLVRTASRLCCPAPDDGGGGRV